MLDHLYGAFISALLYAVHISALSAFMLVCCPQKLEEVLSFPSTVGTESRAVVSHRESAENQAVVLSESNQFS